MDFVGRQLHEINYPWFLYKKTTPGLHIKNNITKKLYNLIHLHLIEELGHTIHFNMG